MTAYRTFLSAFICCAIMVVPAAARTTNSCANDIFRRQNPDICTNNKKMSVATTATLATGTVALIGGAAALIGMSSASSSDDRAPSVASTGMTANRNSYNEVGNDIDTARLASVANQTAYARNINQYDQIRLKYSLARGYTGKNSTVAVFDSGTNAWHGRNVANMINEQIAPDATVDSYVVSDMHGNFKSFDEIGDIIASAQDAHIYNFSWSATNFYTTQIHSQSEFAYATSQHFVDTLKNAAVNNDAIFVWAAGNESASQSSALSALPNTVPETAGHFVNVVAWDDKTGTLADFSNACGETMNYCITAPGSDLHSQKTSLTLNGTSFAAPIVSGAIAVIREAFPYMKATEITNLLFTTARDLGATGVDAVYGHGMLDMERATRPVGVTTIPISDDSSVAMNQPARVSSTIAHQLKSANVTFSFVDSFGRAFETNLNDNISVKPRGIGFERLRQSNDKVARFGNFEFGVKETDMLMANGFLQTDSKNHITFIGTHDNFDFGKFNLFYHTTFGTMNPDTAPESVVSGFSKLYTMSTKFGVQYNDFEFSVGTPDTIIDGNMYLNTLHSRDASGNLIFQNHTIDIATRPSVEFSASYKFMTMGFVDNPYSTDEFYFIAKTRLQF